MRQLLPLGLLLSLGCRGSEGVGPSATPRDLTTMSVGEVRVFNPADVWDGFLVPSAPSAQGYVFIVGNSNPQLDVVASYVVKTNPSTAGLQANSAAPDVATQSNSLITDISPAPTAQESIDSRIRTFERSGLTLESGAGPLRISRSAARSARLVSAAVVPALGDTLSVKIPDAATTNLCKNFIPTRAVVASVSRRAILAVDTLDGPPQTLFTQPVLDSIAQEFDNIIFPTDSSYFNNPTDVDGNGRIIILFTGQVNKLTSPLQSDLVGGFFFAGDFFPTTGTQDGTFCPQSNNAEIFYVMSPDPTGKFNNVRSTSSVRQATRGTVAHEFQHMINSGNRYVNPAVKAFEVSWLDEALAHFAEDAVGRTQRGFTDLQTLTLGDLLPPGNQQAANDFNAFLYQNLARLTYWMVRPDTSSGISAHTDKNLSSRGAAWAMLRHAADNYSAGDPRALTHRLSLGPDTGVKNFTAATNTPIDTALAGWLVSMYADHLGIPGLDQKYQYRSYNFRSVMPTVARSVLGLQAPAYPLQILSIGSPASVSSTNRSGSGTYYSLGVPANGGPIAVRIVSRAPNALLNCCIQTDKEWRSRLGYPGAHVYVLRTQ